MANHDEISKIMNHYEDISKIHGSATDHSKMDHSKMDHSTMDHSTINHITMDRSTMDHNTMDHSKMDHSKMDHHAMHSRHEHRNFNMHDNDETLNAFLSSKQNTFCNGNMAMNMDGFVLNLKGGKDTTCINYLLPSLTLNTRGKFIIAMIITVGFGILLEYLSKVRNSYQKRFYYNSRTTRGKSTDKYKLFLLHLLQSFLGYIGMMIAMTYSLELLFCTVFGLGLGYAYFFVVSSGTTVIGNETSNVNYSQVVSTSNPCCNFVNEDMISFDNDPN